MLTGTIAPEVRPGRAPRVAWLDQHWGVQLRSCSVIVAVAVVISAEAQTGTGVTEEPVCGTVDSVSDEYGYIASAPCQFPFQFGGETFSNCAIDERDGFRWCATRVEDEFITNWGQ